MREISQELSSGMTAELDAFVSSLGPGKTAFDYFNAGQFSAFIS